MAVTAAANAANPRGADATVVDEQLRPARDLRVSVTDRCDFRCRYCMPEAHYEWLPREDILSFAEIATIVEAFASIGVAKVRITGGEPLLRPNLASLIERIAAIDGIEDISLTTNGAALARNAARLFDAGLNRVTVSIDTMRPERHRQITGRDNHAAVLNGIETLGSVGFTGTKLNSVVMRGVNDDEAADLLAFAAQTKAELRFIEYMDVGGATDWTSDLVVGADQLLEQLREQLGAVNDEPTAVSAPARRYSLATGQTFGIVASTTKPFCSTCDRSRLTADGMWLRCLYAAEGTNLRALVRPGGGREELAAFLAATWKTRNDQGAVDRSSIVDRTTAVPVELLRRDPHLEMHTRGG